MSVHYPLLYFAELKVSLFTGMAEVSKQYNLRHIPVQLQLLDDSQFISQLMKQQENSVQVSDSNSSASDLNCSDLVQSDGETSNDKSKNDSNSDCVAFYKQTASTSISQDTINAQILAQLQSQRLTKIESIQCKKSTYSTKIIGASKKSKHKTPVTLPQVTQSSVILMHV